MPGRRLSQHLEDDPLWYKDAIIYEVHVRSFFDADGDGIGDFRGLTQKLDYLEDLGITAIWILPFYPSPGRDDGYDIADYKGVNPVYGTLRDFQVFLREAHRRGLRVITELVLNHTSDQHPWFERSRRAPARSKWRNFYVWNDSADRYSDARIIFKDFEHSNWSWDSIGGAYYWHRFYSHQPDLNFENPAVRKAMLDVVDFWLGMGVDGMRLDAVPYLHEREGTSCENLPETHGYLKELRAHVEARFPNRMLLAEANQWPEDAVSYFGDGDECHMAFHFPLMPRLFMATRMEDRFPIVEILDQTPPIPDSCQWAIFLRNHDELTLEMVTDEERDYMNRVYAQDPAMRINLGIRRRFAPLMENNRRKMELLNALLFSLPGTPVVYYGDEIGMGDNVYLGDRNGVRTPMQWSADRNAGFSRANPQRLHAPVIIDPEYHYEAINVETQHNNPHWLLWWMKRLMELRKRHKSFSRGTLDLLHPENRKVLAYLRRYENETILVVANLSRFVQGVELDLSEFRGSVPVELFGRTAFPQVGDQRYFLSLGPHTFYWFDLQPQMVLATPLPTHADQLPVIRAGESWSSIFTGRGRHALGTGITNYVKGQRWFGGKARPVRTITVADVIPFKRGREVGPFAYIAILRVEYFEGESEQYVLPLTVVSGDQVDHVLRDYPRAAVARIRTHADEPVLLIDALWDTAFAEALLQTVIRRRSIRGEAGELRGSATRSLRRLRGPASEVLPSVVMRGEQSNTSIVFGERLIMKVFRRLDRGVNPELEIGRLLADLPVNANIPATAGALEYFFGSGEPATLGILQEFVPNGVDGWTYTTDELGRYFERVLATTPELDPSHHEKHLLDLVDSDPPEEVSDLIGPYLESARLLGVRTAELHTAFASIAHHAFAPEAYTPFQQRAMFQGMQSGARQIFRTLRDRQRHLPEGPVRELAERLLELETDVLRRFGAIIEGRISGRRIRTHGDYHLGQVLYTGKDFVIIDFEGEPSRPLGERRLKRSALRDVAGMLRSFHYAAFSPLMEGEIAGSTRSRDATQAELGARLWYAWVGAMYLRAYLGAAEGGQFLPTSRDELRVVLDVHLLEKAIYELGYELNNRPEWVEIPIRGVLDLVQPSRSVL